MIDVKRYSLDDAVSFIKDKKIKPYSISILLHEAKNDKIKICFIPENRELRYIQLDKELDNKRVLPCEHLPPKDKGIQRYVVIPADEERYIFFSDLIVPENDQVFPLISRSALSTFEINVNNKTANINPSKLSALDKDGNIIEIAIVEGKWILNNAELAKWLEEKGFPKKYNEGYYYETLSSMEIDRSELCIPAQELNAYIERIKTKRDKTNPMKLTRSSISKMLLKQ